MDKFYLIDSEIHNAVSIKILNKICKEDKIDVFDINTLELYDINSNTNVKVTSKSLLLPLLNQITNETNINI